PQPTTCLPCTPHAPPAPYTLSLHDALPISTSSPSGRSLFTIEAISCSDDPPGRSVLPTEPANKTSPTNTLRSWASNSTTWPGVRSEEHTSELQSRGHLVCRLLLEKKKAIER